MEEKQKERQMTGFDFRKEAEGLLDFIDKSSATAFHTVANAAAHAGCGWLLPSCGERALGTFGRKKILCDRKWFLSDCLYDSGRERSGRSGCSAATQ